MFGRLRTCAFAGKLGLTMLMPLPVTNQSRPSAARATPLLWNQIGMPARPSVPSSKVPRGTIP